MKLVCQNCGREHEGKLVETFTDGDGKPIQIEVCKQPRYDLTPDQYYKYITSFGV